MTLLHNTTKNSLTLERLKELVKERMIALESTPNFSASFTATKHARIDELQWFLKMLEEVK